MGFVLALVLSRLLGASGYGAYTFAFASASLLTAPAVLGLTPVLVRNVAAYKAQGRWAELRGILRRSNQTVFATSVVLAVGAAAGALVLVDAGGDFLRPFLVGLTLVPLLALSSVRIATLQALGHVVLGRLPETIVAPGAFLVLVVLAAFLPLELSATWAIALQAVATAVAFGVGVVLVRRLLPDAVTSARPKYETRIWARSALPLLFVSGLAAVNLQAGTVALGFATDSAEVGIYAVAVRIAALTGFLAVATVYALMPEIARLHATSAVGELDAVLRRSAQIVLLLSTPLALAFIAVPGFFLGIFGETFEAGETVLRILVLGELAKLAFGYASSALAMTGLEDEVLKGAVAGAISNVALLVALVPPFGAEGAAVAFALSGVATQSVHAYLAWTRAGLYTPALRLPGIAR
jgi:O-antigen/teichoic acid export membrane protein